MNRFEHFAEMQMKQIRINKFEFKSELRYFSILSFVMTNYTFEMQSSNPWVCLQI